MSTAAREHRRLAIAGELIERAMPRARSDRAFPMWVNRTLSADRRFGSRDRRFYRELIYTAVRFLPWIESVRNPDRALAALWLSAESIETRDARGVLLPDAHGNEQALQERADSFVAAFPGSRARLHELFPDWVADESADILEPSEAAVIHSRAPLWLRARSGDVAAAIDALGIEKIVAAAGDKVPGAMRVISGPDVSRSRAYAGGVVEVQDIGSQWVLHTAMPAAGERWLDACAGAGGKTLQLAALVGSGTPVVAHDVRPEALEELVIRAKRAGIGSIRVEATVQGEFDAILVDAPCSGSGTWRRAPHLKWQTGRSDLKETADLQLAILTKFAASVRPGGRLVYATCSLARTENEGVVAAFLAGKPGFSAELPGSTLLPSRLDSDGFFVAVLRRSTL